MKRINILLTIIAILLASCSKPSLEDKAKERIRFHVDKIFSGNAKHYEVRDFETLFADDSVCVIQYDVYAENYSREKATLTMEYFILWTLKKELVEDFYILEGNNSSVMDKVSKFYEGQLPKEKPERSHSLRASIPAFQALSLKKVKEE